MSQQRTSFSVALLFYDTNIFFKYFGRAGNNKPEVRWKGCILRDVGLLKKKNLEWQLDSQKKPRF